jgi:hypothetical protein
MATVQQAPGLWRTDLQEHELRVAVRNVGCGKAAELTTDVVEQGKPLLVLVE